MPKFFGLYSLGEKRLMEIQAWWWMYFLKRSEKKFCVSGGGTKFTISSLARGPDDFNCGRLYLKNTKEIWCIGLINERRFLLYKNLLIFRG